MQKILSDAQNSQCVQNFIFPTGKHYPFLINWVLGEVCVFVCVCVCVVGIKGA